MTEKKQLIVADDVRQAARRGEKIIGLTASNSMVTAEARSVAAELGIQIKEIAIQASAKDGSHKTGPGEDIRELVKKHLGTDGGHLSEKITEEVLKRIREKGGTNSPKKLGSIKTNSPLSGGISLSVFPLKTTGEEKILTAAGFMSWQGSQSWSRNLQTLIVALHGNFDFAWTGGSEKVNEGDVWVLPVDESINLKAEHLTTIFHVTYAGDKK